MFKKLRKISPMVRAVGTMGAVAAVAGGITFAQLTTNTVALTGNEMDVTSNILEISNGGAFSPTSVSGYSNPGLIIGTEGPKQPFYLQNLSNDNVAISVNIPNTPSGTNLNLSDVLINFYDYTGAKIASPTIASLEGSSPTALNSLPALAQGSGSSAVPGNYTYSITVEPGAATGSAPGIPSFDLDFTGTQS